MANTEIAETPELIPSNKVEGTTVYDSAGQRLGSIHALMVNKRSGQVTHAVLRTGGLMGIGADYQLLPWNSLDFDEEADGYVAEADAEAEQAAAPNPRARFNYALGIEPIGHYGLDNSEDSTQ